MEGIKISPELLKDFRNISENPNEPSPENNGTGANNKMAVQSLEKSLGWITKTLDGMAKEKGLPGIGKLSPDELAELTVIVIERNLPSEFMQKSPEIMLGSIVSGLVLQNFMALKGTRKKEEKEVVNE